MKRINRLWLQAAAPKRLGWPGLLTLLLAAMALALGLWLNSQEAALQDRREALNQQRQGLMKQQRQQRVADVRQPPSSRQGFIASFPEDSQRQARTAALLALATEQGLPWPRSEFRYGADAALGLAQYRIGMSLSGSYAQIRSYVAEALRRDPALALESLRLRRVQPGAPELAAELGWVLQMRLPGAEASP